MQTNTDLETIQPLHLVYVWLKGEDDETDLTAERLTLEQGVNRAQPGDPRWDDLSVAIVLKLTEEFGETTLTVQSTIDCEIYEFGIDQVIKLMPSDILSEFDAVNSM